LRTVLVCVRTPRAARDIASAATRLGVAAAVRTAVSEPEVMLRLAEQPADIVLVDTAVTRPDCVEFTRRVLARAPAAVIVLLGSEGPRAATAAIAAGARGVIRGGDSDLVGVVAKAVLLLGVPDHPTGTRTAPGAPPTAPDRSGGASGSPGSDNPAVVPAQRDDEARAPVALGAHPNGPGPRPGDAAGPAVPPAESSGRVALTERESQVLRGMADGKSNAEIGREIFVSEDTVKTHARRLFRKLGARDRAHAVAAGFRAGLVT
jgi:DNA-binding NarL/FixJ family response regulator